MHFCASRQALASFDLEQRFLFVAPCLIFPFFALTSSFEHAARSFFTSLKQGSPGFVSIETLSRYGHVGELPAINGAPAGAAHD